MGFFATLRRTVRSCIRNFCCACCYSVSGKMGCVWDRKMISVLLVSLGFLGIFTAFQTMGNIQKTMLDSIHQEDNNFNGDGYTSLAIIYAVFAIFNWGVPSMIILIGPKWIMLFGGLTYLFFIATFLIPRTWLLYFASFVIGVGAPAIWTGQGNYLTLNSTPATISRNSGIFWALLQCSMFIGNLIVYFQFQGMTRIDEHARFVVILVLVIVCAIGVGIIVVLPPTKKPEEGENGEEVQNPVQALVGAGKLFITKDMLLLCVTFLYTGLELGFYSGVYSPSLGFTLKFPSSKELVGLSGIFIGVGEVLGGALFGIMGAKFSRFGRDPIVIGGFVVHMLAFLLIFFNIPNQAVFHDTNDSSLLTSSVPLAIFCSFLLGFGDACYNTQIYSMLGGAYADNSASAFAIFKFTQSIAAAASFFYASHVALYPQLGILVVFGILGSIAFVMVEWRVKKRGKAINTEGSEDGRTTK